MNIGKATALYCLQTCLVAIYSSSTILHVCIALQFPQHQFIKLGAGELSWGGFAVAAIQQQVHTR
jgi:hypothetical protein